MTWGVESHVIERFAGAGVPPENISFDRDTFIFRANGTPAAFVDDFITYYGPTMNAFDAAEKNGRGTDLRRELEDLFTKENTSTAGTTIPATFLRVTVAR